ncbi:MAG: BREX system P-loop protein BrxC, partial [Candidatus Thorarchaeota archaeon]
MPEIDKKKIEKIKDIFSLDINRYIEEIIKVDQTDEEKVYNELQEYIITDSINDYFEEILEVYNLIPQNPTENVGIWVSGFFGSGKSSFAKILGLILENKNIKNSSSSDLFLNRTRSDKLTSLLLSINSNIETETIVFDISKHRSAKDQTERMTLLMYKMFLKHLGYSDDLELAKLEMDLEEMGSYQEFIELYEKKYKKSWISGRKIINFALNEASVVLNELFPENYPALDSWAKTKRGIDISAIDFSKQLNALLERRKKPANLIFIIDEVGQYISRSSDKMLDLQAIVESFGISDQGKVWVMVTSQEKLDEVVDSLEGKKIELAKIQDRFQIQVDLAPRDISEVTSKRILVKTLSAEEFLKKLFKNNKNIIKTYTKLESSARSTEITEKSFVNLYPFLPYQIDLIIDVISGIRSQPGASKHTGGSNRTVIKLAQQVLVHPRTELSEKVIGYLVTLDMIYDLIEGNLY